MLGGPDPITVDLLQLLTGACRKLLFHLQSDASKHDLHMQCDADSA